MNEKKKIIEREQEIIFTNWTEEDFEHTWNKRLYRFKAGKSYYLAFYLAEHFGKHLVTRELNKMVAKELGEAKKSFPGIDKKELERREQSILTNVKLRQELMDKCVIITEPDSVDRVSPREVPVQEVKLKAQERAEGYVEKGIVSPADVKGVSVGGARLAPEEGFEGAK